MPRSWGWLRTFGHCVGPSRGGHLERPEQILVVMEAPVVEQLTVLRIFGREV